jgi:hypothetical protein
VRFDDRLLTVLNQPAEDRHDVAVRWRQLVDLVARAGANSGSPVVRDALEAIRSEAHLVDEPLRAAAARAVAALPLPLALLEYFAGESLAVAAPVLAAATLDSSQWSVLRAAGEEETQAFIDTLHPDVAAQPHVEPERVVTSPTPALPAQQSAEPAVPPTYTPPSLHDVVERIEQRRRMRTGDVPVSPSPPTAKATALFRWECGPSGDLAWVEGAPRGALIGRSIAKPIESDGDRVDQQVVRAFAMRAPFRDALLTLAAGGPVSGDWKISGVPAFDSSDGRFAGYRGVALREMGAPPAAAAPDRPTELLADPDSLRELVHEIKTPLNAIIGFAEIIEGQYLGPADRGYRERASEIVRQAGLLVMAIDDLDFAAKVHSAGGARERVDLAALVEREAPELRELARKKGVDIDLAHIRFQVLARVQAELADRLLFRLFGALVDIADVGDRLQLSVDLASDGARISISRPTALRGMTDAEQAGGTSAANGRHGAFTLRLVRGLARIAGGDLVSGRDTFALVFPRA